MVLVVAQHNLAEPCTNLGRAMMLPTLKLRLDGFELRGHPPLRRNPPDDESSVTVALPAVVSETQKRKGPGFPSPRAVSGLRLGRNPVRKAFEVDLVDLVENRHHSLLNDFVLQCCDAQRTLPPVGLRYIDSS
jgi:hypothetical protein